MAEWYFAEGDKQLGPVSGEDLKQRIQSGQLPQSTLVWEQLMKDWTPASRVAYFASPGAMGPPPVLGEAAYASVMVTYAGFWKRFAAFIIDWIILSVANVIVQFIFGLIYALSISNPDQVTALLYVVLINLCTNLLYFTLFESSSLQATPGKLALGIIVTDLDGNRISYARAVGRYFASFFSYVTLFIGFIMAGLTERKQALHDLIARCLVVNKG